MIRWSSARLTSYLLLKRRSLSFLIAELAHCDGFIALLSCFEVLSAVIVSLAEFVILGLMTGGLGGFLGQVFLVLRRHNTSTWIISRFLVDEQC